MRHANVDWILPEGVPGTDGRTIHQMHDIHTALFMDIRDELQALNKLLKVIAKNTKKKCKPHLRIKKAS